MKRMITKPACHTMKKIFSILLVLALLCTTLPQLALFIHAEPAYSGQIGNLSWAFDPDSGLLTVAGTGEIENYPSQPWPWKEFKDSVRKITIGNGITTIGCDAFCGFASLSELSISETVTVIDAYAFDGCKSLAGLVIPDGVQKIVYYAFRGCTDLSSVVIGAGAKDISSEAFDGCSSLERFTVSPENAYFCNDSYGALFDKNKTTLVRFPPAFQGGYTIPQSVKTIYSFADCTGLTSIDMPNGLERISQSAFSSCSGLTTLTIPDSVTVIDSWAFQNCTGLTHVSIGAGLQFYSVEYGTAFLGCSHLLAFAVSENNPELSSDSFGVLYNKDKTIFIDCPDALEGSYSLPETVVELNGRAFQNCAKLTELNIGSHLETISAYCFTGCDRLERINIAADNPNYCSDKSGCVFNKDKTAMLVCPPAYSGSYQLPDMVTEVQNAFLGCSKLTELSFGSQITGLNSEWFTGCDQLAKIHVSESHPDYSSDAFGCVYNKNMTVLLICPPGMHFSCTVPAFVTEIASGAFYHCDDLVTITLPDTITKINPETFCYCSNLAAVILPDSVTALGESAFNACKNLKKYVIPKAVTDIGEMALGYAYEITSFDVFTQKYEDTTIFGYENSAAETYAAENEFTFVPITTTTCAEGHQFGAWEEALEPECTEGGAEARTCSCCGTMEFRQTEAIGHEFEDGYCIRCGKRQTASDMFSDVKDSAYYAKAVLWAVQNGITGGTGEGKFSPKGTCKREQVVTFLYAAANKPEYTQSESPFTDVKQGKYYFNSVMWAVENKVTGGVSDTLFGVGKPCTREQVVSFLWKAAGSPAPESTESPFTDVKPGKYYYKAVLWANENGITGGAGDGLFGVGKTCTRAQIVTFLYKAYADQ